MKFDIWEKGLYGLKGTMYCNHTMQTINDMKMHSELNIYLLHSPFFDVRGVPIVEYNFVKYIEPVAVHGNISKGEKVQIEGKVKIAMVQFRDGCFVVVEKNGNVLGKLKDVVEWFELVVVGNRFQNKEYFE